MFSHIHGCACVFVVRYDCDRVPELMRRLGVNYFNFDAGRGCRRVINVSGG